MSSSCDNCVDMDEHCTVYLLLFMSVSSYVASYHKSRNVHKYLTFTFFTNDCDSQKLHVWKLINGMVLLALSHQTVKALLAELEYLADLWQFTPM